MSNDNQNKSDLERAMEHMEYAAKSIAKWPEWQKGLLQASSQPKLATPRTVKVNPTEGVNAANHK